MIDACLMHVRGVVERDGARARATHSLSLSRAKENRNLKIFWGEKTWRRRKMRLNERRDVAVMRVWR